MSVSDDLKAVELPFGKVIYQLQDSQGVSTDTSFLVETILAEEQDAGGTILELGSGNGIIVFMLGHYLPKSEIYGIEIQEDLVELSQENSKLCEVKAIFERADIKDYTAQEPVNLIVSNPPYLPVKKGRISPVYSRAISRHELLCNISDVVFCVKRNLVKGGKAYILNLSERATEIKDLVEQENMELDKIYSGLSFQRGKISIFRIRK